MKKLNHLVIITTLFSFLFVSCQTTGGNGPIVKVYTSKPEQGGLVRAQDSEIIQYADSENYRCLNKEDFDKLINYCFNPDRDNEFEKTRIKLRSTKKKYQKLGLKNVVKNYIISFENEKEIKKEKGL